MLDVIKNEKLMMNAKAIGDYMIAVLKKITGVKEVRGRGLMIGVELEFPCNFQNVARCLNKTARCADKVLRYIRSGPCLAFISVLDL